MRLEILLTAVLFFGGTTLSGYALCRLLKLKNEGLLFHCIAGTMLWWALMEVVLLPLTFLLAPFHLLMICYSAPVGILSALGLFSWREISEDGKRALKSWKQYVTPGHFVALGLICYQLYFIHHHMYLEWDDTYYVNLANEAISSDRIFWVYPETGTMASFDERYVLSLWPVFYAWLSKIIGVSPTIMAHTILPWILIPAVYMVYVLLGRRLFKNDSQMQGMFLGLAVLVHLFMTGEHIAGLTFLTITPWVGKGLLAALMFPLLLYWALRTAEEDKAGLWILFCITCLAGCLLTSMGILLLLIFTAVSVLIMSFVKKRWSYLCKGALACLPCFLLGVFYVILVSTERKLFVWGIFLK